MPRDEDTLVDIVQFCRRIRRFTAGLNETTFYANEMALGATQHSLLLLGEAVNRLSTEFKSQHPEIPWRKITGMRNILIHDYDDVEDQEVWDAASNDVPALLARLEPLVPKEKG